MPKTYDNLDKAVIRLYCIGEPVKQIADKLGVSRDVINRIICDYWLPSMPKQIYEVLDDYAVINIKCGNKWMQTKIDVDDIDRCQSLGKWSYNSNGYVFNGGTGIYLSRFIMNCPDGFEVDHINHDTLDNRKENLRIVTSTQNHFNQRNSRLNKSGHRGVSWSKERQKWCVYLKNAGKTIAKRFDMYEDACRFADEIIERWHGEFKYNPNQDGNRDAICGLN